MFPAMRAAVSGSLQARAQGRRVRTALFRNSRTGAESAVHTERLVVLEQSSRSISLTARRATGARELLTQTHQVARSTYSEHAAGASSTPADDSAGAFRPPGAAPQSQAGSGTGLGRDALSSSAPSQSGSEPFSARLPKTWSQTERPGWLSTPPGKSSDTSRPGRVSADARTASG